MHVHVHVYTFPFRSSTAETTDKLIAINSVVPCPLRHDSPMYSPSKLKFLYLSSRHILYPLHLLHASAIIYTLLVFGLSVDFSFFDSVHDQFAVPTYVSFFFSSFFFSLEDKSDTSVVGIYRFYSILSFLSHVHCDGNMVGRIEV